MTEPLQPATVTRIEKVAVDNGFDLVLPGGGQWRGFASTQAPLRLWLTALGPGQLIAALSQLGVARALADRGTAPTVALPPGAAGAISVADIPTLHRLVRRAFQLSKTLPDELLHAFEEKVAALPRTTEAERLVVQRVGQDVFRHGLLDYWDGRCAITGLAVPELLRASHIKPWAACENDAERLSVFNGLLLAPHLDAAFDTGLISVAMGGGVVVSSQLADADKRLWSRRAAAHSRPGAGPSALLEFSSRPCVQGRTNALDPAVQSRVCDRRAGAQGSRDIRWTVGPSRASQRLSN